jgi:release factor glutamine methyltransferase
MSLSVANEMTVAEVIAEATQRLSSAGIPTPRQDAERLLAHLLCTDRGGIVARRPDPLDPAIASELEALIARREQREPFQHLTGTQEFYGLDIAVDRRALIPRPETEGLVDAVLSFALPERALVIDLGTGTGCIPIALAATRCDLRLRALERSRDALDLARANVAAHGLESRIELIEGDLAEPPAAWAGTAGAVVSNPPYVPEREWRELEPEVRDHEPRDALVPGDEGLEAFHPVARAARGLLGSGGRLALEIGYGQADAVRAIVAAAGFRDVEVRPDLRGIPRVVVATREETA